MARVRRAGGPVWSVTCRLAGICAPKLPRHTVTRQVCFTRVFFSGSGGAAGRVESFARTSARAGWPGDSVAAMSILGTRGPSTSSCDVSASADLTGARGYAVQGSSGRAGGRNEPSSAAERARSAGTATSRLDIRRSSGECVGGWPPTRSSTSPNHPVSTSRGRSVTLAVCAATKWTTIA